MRNQGFTFLLITQDLNKFTKPEHHFVDIVHEKMCAQLQEKKILNSIWHWSSSAFQANSLVSRKQ